MPAFTNSTYRHARRAEKLQAAKQIVTIPMVAARFCPGWTPKGSCRSPFREDRHPSFSVFENGRAFKDHATGEGGDVVRFLQMASGLSPGDAIRQIIDMAGLAENKPTPQKQARRSLSLPDDLHVGNTAELQALARLRGISPEACILATERGLLKFTRTFRDGEDIVSGWVILDGERRNAQVRRLDGKPIGSVDAKAKTLPGSIASWPVGASTCEHFPQVAFCEGGPDLLAALHFAWAEGAEDRVAVCAMLGAGLSIAADALPCFRGRHVRLFPHLDDAGRKAASNWTRQLRAAGANVDAFNVRDVVLMDGSTAADLNDLARMDADVFEDDRALWSLFSVKGGER